MGIEGSFLSSYVMGDGQTFIRGISHGLTFFDFLMTTNTDNSDSVGIPVAVAAAKEEGHYVVPPSTTPQIDHLEDAEEPKKKRGLIESAMTTAGGSFALIIAYFTAMMFDIFAFTFVLSFVVTGVTMIPAACCGLLVLVVLKGLLRPIAKMDEVLYARRKALYDVLLDKKEA
ncbi:unnamed protein product [Aphanomyces euteiches]|uniref:Uncharacterized protein n=1 Tax=Aphanomyces euteiches TaxID=100861 RepID=A0A6G0XXU6_9STRA|nr:hypothetical protein Ae201684_000026 [Aphanomyces euteiches]KAH9051756.1 hypothetical protein Ae201684P_015594 [Aphanomyces euteiches]KAH9120807.1 hypothetical protein LEN26_010964 [Aphanomyces euteiches]KAH9139426.1 hypothetical protein AeRB84_016304 [Aphanomyces euteiches]